MKAYVEAAERDPASPEPWTRMAHVWCSSGRGGADAEDALAHAVELDPAYARAWAVKAFCAGNARGHGGGARGGGPGGGARSAGRRREHPARPGRRRRGDVGVGARGARGAHDPTAPIRWPRGTRWPRGRRRTATWPLWARALAELARLAPERRESIARSAEELAGAGETSAARKVAAAALEASRSPMPERLALAARLAVDEALARHDAQGALRRATRARVSLDEAAGRALLDGDRGLARQLASTAAAADPGALGARLVLAVAEGADLLGPAAAPRSGDAPASAAALVAFGAALLHVASPAQARETLAAAPRLPMVAGDDRVERAAVELASHGVLPVDALPPDGAVELFVVAASPGRLPVPADATGLDLRHRYLALALPSPPPRGCATSPRACTPCPPPTRSWPPPRRSSSWPTAAPSPRDAPRILLARNPADPLLAATALRLAEKIGDRDVARRARETLSAVRREPRRSVD